MASSTTAIAPVADPSSRRRREPRWAGTQAPLAISLARVASRLSAIPNHRGTAFPGKAAERVWPGALAALARQLDAVVVVIGTNGKTTTAGLIAEILGQDDPPPIANRSGSNMRQGITTSLIRASDLRGRLRHGPGGPPKAVFEVDEAALGQILPNLGRSVIVATNLFRDQLDRYGEADAIVDRWTAAFATAADGSVLVYCADDPRLAMLADASPLPSRSFGLGGRPPDREQRPSATDVTADPIACPACGRQLTYAWRSVGHLGSYACPEGHVRRSAPHLSIEPAHAPAQPTTEPWAVASSPVTLDVGGPGGRVVARPALAGLANAYNVAAAMAAGMVLGRDVEQAAASIEGYAGPFGRMEWIEIRGRHVAIVLIKNTVSLAETVGLGPFLGADVVLLGLNDAPADGRDVSWIWDGPLARLVADRSVVLTGSRAADLELRLRYDLDATIAPPRSIERGDPLATALDMAVDRSPVGGIVVVAASYTAMMGLRAIAQRRGLASAVPH